MVENAIDSAGYIYVLNQVEKETYDRLDGTSPMWHGWALREAFHAGAKWAEEQAAAPAGAEIDAIVSEVKKRAYVEVDDMRRLINRTIRRALKSDRRGGSGL